ncbi:hypothetical protein U0070_008239, partial [Myodes glareolus]
QRDALSNDPLLWHWLGHPEQRDALSNEPLQSGDSGKSLPLQVAQSAFCDQPVPSDLQRAPGGLGSPSSLSQRSDRRRSKGGEERCWRRGCPHQEATCPSSRNRNQHDAQLVVMIMVETPFKLLVSLAALCCKMEVPYCIISGKAWSHLVEAIHTNCGDRYEEMPCCWGGNVPIPKSAAHVAKLEKA